MKVQNLSLVALVLFQLLLPTSSFADNLNPENLVAMTLKTLAKGYVLTMDVTKVKTKEIKKISGMNDAKFHKQYQRVYDVLKGIPSQMRVRYGLSENMTKQKAIENIGQMQKKDMMKFIDGVPDKVIVKEVNDYFKRTAQNVGHNPVRLVDALWHKMMSKM